MMLHATHVICAGEWKLIKEGSVSDASRLHKYGKGSISTYKFL